MSEVPAPDSENCMKKKCLVCKSTENLFSFPPTLNRSLLWLKLLNIKDLPNKKSFKIFKNRARLCILHFHKRAFANSLKKELHPNVLPNIKYHWQRRPEDELCRKFKTKPNDGYWNMATSYAPSLNDSDISVPSFTRKLKAIPDTQQLSQPLGPQTFQNKNADNYVLSRKSYLPLKDLLAQPKVPFPSVYPVQLIKAAGFQTEDAVRNVVSQKSCDLLVPSHVQSVNMNSPNHLQPVTLNNFLTKGSVGSLKFMTGANSSVVSYGVQPITVTANNLLQPVTLASFLTKNTVDNVKSSNISESSISSNAQPLTVITNTQHLLPPETLSNTQTKSSVSNAKIPSTGDSPISSPLLTITSINQNPLHSELYPNCQMKNADKNKTPQNMSHSSSSSDNQEEVTSTNVVSERTHVKCKENSDSEKEDSDSEANDNIDSLQSNYVREVISRNVCIVCKTHRKPLFCFPKNEKKLVLWLKSLNMDYYQKKDYAYLHHNARVCILHFEDKDFTSSLRRRLSKYALPLLLDVNQHENFDHFTETAESEYSSYFKENVDKSTSSAIEQSSLLKLLKDKLTASEYTFLLEQLKISKMYGKCRGWTQDEMSFVLQIHNYSPEAYKLLKKFLKFPTKLTLKRFTFDDPKLQEFVQNMDIEDSELSDDTLSSSDHRQDSDGDGILDKAINAEGMPKIANVISMDKLIPVTSIKRECPSPGSSDDEYEEDKCKILMSQIQCQIESSHRKCELLLKRSKKMKQRNSQLTTMLMLACETAKDC